MSLLGGLGNAVGGAVNGTASAIGGIVNGTANAAVSTGDAIGNFVGGGANTVANTVSTVTGGGPTHSSQPGGQSSTVQHSTASLSQISHESTQSAIKTFANVAHTVSTVTTQAGHAVLGVGGAIGGFLSMLNVGGLKIGLGTLLAIPIDAFGYALLGIGFISNIVVTLFLFLIGRSPYQIGAMLIGIILFALSVALILEETDLVALSLGIEALTSPNAVFGTYVNALLLALGGAYAWIYAYQAYAGSVIIGVTGALLFYISIRFEHSITLVSVMMSIAGFALFYAADGFTTKYIFVLTGLTFLGLVVGYLLIEGGLKRYLPNYGVKKPNAQA